MITEEYIKQKIKKNIKDANIVVADLAGDQKHFSVDVISDDFKNKSMVEQHKMIYNALGTDMKKQIHALKIKTSTYNNQE